MWQNPQMDKGQNWVPEDALNPPLVDHEGQIRVVERSFYPGGYLGALESDMTPSPPEPDGGGAPRSNHDATRETPGG